MKRPFKVIQLYKALGSGETLLPTDTGFTFWEETYETAPGIFDREFARRYTTFDIFDFMDAENISDAKDNFKADILSILTFNKKRYDEMYRVFLVEDADDPITYNYDMVETTGAQHSETEYGATSETKGAETFTKGAETFTKGAESDTIGGTTTSHNVFPFNSLTASSESSDEVSEQNNTEGQREDTTSQREDTTSARTDTALAHTDSVDTDEWTLSRRGNIGTQTAADILRLHTSYWTETYKFFNLIFDDIAKQLLMVGD